MRQGEKVDISIWISASFWKSAHLKMNSVSFNSFWAFLMAQLVKESACNAGDLGLIPGLGRSPGEGKGYPL